MDSRPPFSRPRWTQGYIPTGVDGYRTQLYRIGGFTTFDLRPNPCTCCGGFQDALQCQYGKPCGTKVCAHKPNLVNDQRPQCNSYGTSFCKQ